MPKRGSSSSHSPTGERLNPVLATPGNIPSPATPGLDSKLRQDGIRACEIVRIQPLGRIQSEGYIQMATSTPPGTEPQKNCDCRHQLPRYRYGSCLSIPRLTRARWARTARKVANREKLALDLLYPLKCCSVFSLCRISYQKGLTCCSEGWYRLLHRRARKQTKPLSLAAGSIRAGDLLRHSVWSMEPFMYS